MKEFILSIGLVLFQCRNCTISQPQKGMTLNLKYTTAIVFFFLAVVAAVITRVVQLLTMTESSTGFLKREYENVGVYIAVGLAAVVLILVYLALTSERKPELLPQQSKAVAAASFFMGAALLYEIVRNIGLDRYAFKDSKDLFLSGIQVLLLIATALFFVLFGISHVSDFRFPPILSMFSPIAWVVKLITAFINYTGMANITENLFDIGMLCFSLLFLLNFAKLLCGFDIAKKTRWSFANGLIASLFCFICTIPRYIIIMSGNGNILHETTMPTLADLILGVFIIVYLMVFLSEKNIQHQSDLEETYTTGFENEDFYIE